MGKEWVPCIRNLYIYIYISRSSKEKVDFIFKTER